MPKPQIPEAVRRIFTENFTARDLAEPLLSFDDLTSTEAILQVLETEKASVLGIRQKGTIAGFAERDAWANGTCVDLLQHFDPASIIDADTSLLDVISKLQLHPFLFVTAFGQVAGVITRDDLQKPSARMWLFGLVTLIEDRFTDLILRACPQESWKQYLSEARLHKAQELLAERMRRNQKLELLDCLQFSDKGQIIARCEQARRQTIFPSRGKTEAAVKKIERLRNNLAHAQDLLADWDTIIELSEIFRSSEIQAMGGISE